jgi:signal transduction histidine kinase
MDGADQKYNGPFSDTTAMIVVPLRSNDKVIGVIDIRTSGENRFPGYSVSMAELLGQQLGLYRDLSGAMGRFEDAQRELKAMLRKQTETFEDLGHQLKSPVFQAQARLQAVLRNRTIDDELRLQLSAVRGLIGRIKRVSTSIRLFAQILDNKSVPLQPVQLNPDELRRTLFEYAIDHKLSAERTVTFTIKPDGFGVLKTHQVYVDHDLLEQVVNNVLDNAFKYSFARTNIRVQVGVTGGRFYISVVNEGTRLRSADIEKAKERGWRSEDAESSTGEGSGIGLWIVDQIMKTLGGELRISPTTADHQTEVRLFFPVTK